jgi:hypothetical protein
MNLTALIESAELMFMQILEDYFVTVYDERNLFSHGLDHHRRVWCYAKELLFLPLKQVKAIPSCQPSKLIIACYLHDSGMSVEPGPRHGKHSREFCLQFLENNNLSAHNYEDVLDAIENHDRKDYSSSGARNDLLTLLSVADDLDAFGFTGIYRYSEIYLKRGIVPEQIGPLIIENAARRCENFERIFETKGEYVRYHHKRFDILNNFFIHYNRQVAEYDFETIEPEGYCGVIQLFMLMLRDNMLLNDFFRVAGRYQDDIILGSFLIGLKSELLLNYQDDQE